MWNCPYCGEQNEAGWSSCWRCSLPHVSPPPQTDSPIQPVEAPGKKTAAWRVAFKLFPQGLGLTCEDTFAEATRFANELGPERWIGLSHSGQSGLDLVVGWYWEVGTFWTCPNCGECLEDQFGDCWHCSSPRGEPPPAAIVPEIETTAGPEGGNRARIACQVFRASWGTWDQFLGKAAAFATELGRERLVSITHSGDEEDGVAAVIYVVRPDASPAQASTPGSN